jgi:hypothetical protein
MAKMTQDLGKSSQVHRPPAATASGSTHPIKHAQGSPSVLPRPSKMMVKTEVNTLDLQGLIKHSPD